MMLASQETKAPGMASLPTLPSVALKLGRMISEGEADTKAIAEVMRHDQSLTTRVLTLVNSAYYSVPGGVSDLHRAISYLGGNTIYQVVLTVSVFNVLKPSPRASFNLADLWLHALGAAVISEQIARRTHLLVSGDAFTAGLLHDVGKVALAATDHEMLERIVGLAYAKEITFHEAEDLLEVNPHDQVGGFLSGLWNLPPVVTAAIEHHHHPCPAAGASSDVGGLVALADQICRLRGIGNGGDPVRADPDPGLLRLFQLGHDDLQQMADVAEEQALRTAESLGVC